MLTTKEAIEKRRSVRKFLDRDVDDAVVLELIEAARLAPSGCNAQPWRFKIVKDAATRQTLYEAAYRQKFIAEAPVVIVCCTSIKGYLEGTVSGLQDLDRCGDIESGLKDMILDRTEAMKKNAGELEARISFNLAIAVEHIVLRALDFGLGTCWVRSFDRAKIQELFGWGEDLAPVVLLPLGFPDGEPQRRPRLKREEILL